MRNVIGPFNDKALCKYDLKGSSMNRKEEFEIDNVERIVMKDINFEEIEKYILIPKNEIKRLRNATKIDADFLSDLYVMDYSLFLVKISVNQEEVR